MRKTLAAGSFLVPAILFCGCSLTQEFSRTPRTAVEQLLLTQAIEHALQNLAVELPKDAALHVDVTGLQTDRAHFNMVGEDRGVLHGPSLDLLLIRDAVATGFGRLGYRINPHETEPAYLARVIVESFGTTQGLTFFGMPPVQSVLIPFALPALTLYSAEGQRGYARIHVDFFRLSDGETGRLDANHDRPHLLLSVHGSLSADMANDRSERAAVAVLCYSMPVSWFSLIPLTKEIP